MAHRLGSPFEIPRVQRDPSLVSKILTLTSKHKIHRLKIRLNTKKSEYNVLTMSPLLSVQAFLECFGFGWSEHNSKSLGISPSGFGGYFSSHQQKVRANLKSSRPVIAFVLHRLFQFQRLSSA